MKWSNSKNPKGKSIATFERQKCINLLEKITKNLFRMFRDSSTTSTQLVERFFFLKKKLDELGNIYLDTDHHREMKTYIDNLANTLSSDFNLDDIRDVNMTRLNRIQKLKNANSYKREKHVKKIYEQ